MNLEDYLDFLCTKDNINVHYFDKETEQDIGFIHAESRKAPLAVEDFRNPNSGPVNFLDLDVYKENAIPLYLVGLPRYNILPRMREDLMNHSGKVVERQNNELSACVTFQVCGKTGVVHLPHRDRHGVLTTVFCEAGEKFWMTWPKLREDELNDWAQELDAPDLAPFAIVLDPGDQMLMPPATAHAPFTPKSALCTGSMHWDSKNLVQMRQHSIYERTHPRITNEDPAKEFDIKARIIENIWTAGHEGFPLGSAEDLEKYKSLRKVCLPRPIILTTLKIVRYGMIYSKPRKRSCWGKELLKSIRKIPLKI